MPDPIRFGTDGWRGIIAAEFSFPNVRRVSQALADYLVAHNLGRRGLVVGYDQRFASEDFAAAVAEVLAAGRHTVRWDGRDAAGGAAAPGLYFARLDAPTGRCVARVVTLR